MNRRSGPAALIASLVLGLHLRLRRRPGRRRERPFRRHRAGRRQGRRWIRYDDGDRAVERLRDVFRARRAEPRRDAGRGLDEHERDVAEQAVRARSRRTGRCTTSPASRAGSGSRRGSPGHPAALRTAAVRRRGRPATRGARTCRSPCRATTSPRTISRRPSRASWSNGPSPSRQARSSTSCSAQTRRQASRGRRRPSTAPTCGCLSHRYVNISDFAGRRGARRGRSGSSAAARATG